MTRLSIRNFILKFALFFLAIVILVLTAFISNTVTVTYSDIMGCEIVCVVAASGYPFAFIADYPGLSPADSADLMGALMGWDKIIWLNLVCSGLFWIVLLMLLGKLFKKKYRS